MSNESPSPGDLPLVIEGRYKLLREVGQGGYGRVFLAEDMLLGRSVAFKMLSGFGNMFTALAEVTALASLPRHPNICPYQGTLSVNGSPVIVTPYAPGGSLGGNIQVFSEKPAKILEFALQAAYGLSQVHAFELIHGDVKPQNLLIFEGERLAVSDFGLAFSRSQASHGGIGGTQAYRPSGEGGSPELEQGIDWYSWALTFIEVSLGCRLWNRGADALHILNRGGLLAESSTNGIPRRLARLLVARADARVEVAKEVVGDLATAYLELAGETTPVPPPLAARPQNESINVPGFQRLDRVGFVIGPIVLLVRAIAAVSEAGLDTGPIRDVQDETENQPNRVAYLAASIVTYGRIVDALVTTPHASLEPIMSEAWSEMGLAYSYLGDPFGAIWAQTQAFEILYGRPFESYDERTARKAVGVCLRLAESLSAIGRYQEVCEVIEKALGYPQDLITEIDLKTSLANAQFDMGRFRAAHKMYTQLIALRAPQSSSRGLARLYFERANCLVRLRRPQEAEADVRRCLDAIDPAAQGRPEARQDAEQFAMALKLLATVLTDSGKHRQAVETYSLAAAAYEEFRGAMIDEELEDRIASIELSASFSLEELKDYEACDATLLKSVERRRKILAAGYDACATGLANSLVALAKLHIRRGERSTAWAAVAECLRLSRVLEANGSPYHVHDIAFRSLILLLDNDFVDSNDEYNEGTLRWAMAELDALESIAGATETGGEGADRRIRLLFNSANYAQDPARRLVILDKAAELAVRKKTNDGLVEPLLGEILIKRAAIKFEAGGHAGALEDAARTVQLSKESIMLRESRAEPSAEEAKEIVSYRLNLAESLMFAAVVSNESGFPINQNEAANPADAASESVAILRAIDPSDVPAYRRGQAAMTLGMAANFLPPDPRRNADDSVRGFRLCIEAFKASPSSANFQSLSFFAQIATTRLQLCSDAEGSRNVLETVRSLSSLVVLPDTMRTAALAGLAELVAYLAERNGHR